MKKITFLLLFLIGITGQAQILNQPANWPNPNWTLTGSYSSSAANLEGNPTISSNFSYDDNENGFGLFSQISAESPIIDLTTAHTSGENWITISVDYRYNEQVIDDLELQYWNTDTSTWVTWHSFDTDTPNVYTNHYCNATAVSFTSDILDITNFTATQLSGFRYRFYFNDNGGWVKGFCFDSPTIYSAAPPTCIALDINNITISNITETSVTIDWLAGNSNETNWEVVVQPQGTGEPTNYGNGITVNTTPSVTYPGLSQNTAYEIFIAADCGSGDYSYWAGPINFSTSITPPTPPSGITCTANSASYIFIEEFDEPGQWTGTQNTGNASWEIPDGSTTSNTGPSTAYSGAHYMNFEATGANGDVATIVSPAIDLSGATGAIELSFYMYAYGSDMGTLNIGVGNSPTGVFTPEFTWSGQYQSSDSESWIPVGIDLSAYANQIIYLQFEQVAISSTTSNYNGMGDMAIDNLKVEACGTFCTAPSTFSTNTITDTTANISWIAANGETAWNYIIQPLGSGTPTGMGTPVTGSIPEITLSELIPDTAYELYIKPDCGNGFYGLWSAPYTFNTLIQTDFIVDCTAGPTTESFCYGNNDTSIFSFSSVDGITPVAIYFTAGTVQLGADELVVKDGNDNILYNGYGPLNDGNLSGLTITATTPTLTFSIQSDGSNSCQDGNQGTPIEFMYYCATCVVPTSTFEIVPDCDFSTNQLQFYIDVTITDMGDATSLTISDNQNSPNQNTTTPGVYTFGPYLPTTEVQFEIINNNDPNCFLYSNTMNYNDCPLLTITDNEYTVPQLITDVLINPNCGTASNVTWSGASDYGTGFESIGYFQSNYLFSLDKGIALSTGNILRTSGPNNTELNNGAADWSGDNDLLPYTQNVTDILHNATSVEFDYVPINDNLSFDFIFASEEYTSNFQCNYADVFAILLTDQNGNTTNIATLPDGTTAINVVNIHGDLGSCGPANESFFSHYNNYNEGQIDFNGETVILTAAAPVTPGEQYHIKIAIADEQDTKLDSAVLLRANYTTTSYCTPPPNDNICNAEPLTVLDYGSSVQASATDFQLDLASIEINEPTPSCFNNITGTLWFSFVAPSSGAVAITGYLQTGFTDFQFALYEDNSFNCTDYSGLTEIACSNGSSAQFTGETGLIPGDTYYIQVNQLPSSPDEIGIEVSALPVAGTEDIIATNFKYYPNPVNQNILYIEAEQAIETIEVYNMLGQTLIQQIPNTTKTDINMQNLAKGQYLVKVTIGDNSKVVQIMKE